MSAILQPPKPDFSGAFLKLDRAKAHISDLNAAAAQFFDSNPHFASPEFDPVSKRYGYMIRSRRALPKEFSLTVGDATHNLRSALDHLITACAAANGRDTTRSYFPIVRHRGHLEAAIQKKVIGPGAGPLAADLAREAKPYQRGNSALFAIHCLDIADKHQIVIATKNVMDVSVILENIPLSIRKAFRSARNKRRFIPVPAGMEQHLLPAEICYTSEIVFGAKQPRAGEPCIGELASFIVDTERVINLFATAFR